MCQACCWRRQGRIRRTCFGWVALAGAIEALTKGKGTGKGNAEGDPARKWRIRRAMGKAESGSTGIVTTVELTVTERPKQALGCRNGRTGQGEPQRQTKGKGKHVCTLPGPGRRRRRKETDRVVETEWSTSDRESATDDAWWLGSVNALSRECEMCRAQPPPAMSVANRFAVLAGDVDGDVQLSCQRFGSTNTAKHTGGIQRGTTMRSPEPGQRQKVSWNAADCAGRSAYHESGIWRPQRCVLFPRMHQQKDTLGGGCGGLRSGRKCSTTENIPS